MVTRITAEFESPDLAETALNRIRNNVRGVYSATMRYSHSSEEAKKLRHGSIYTVLPVAPSAQNFLTAVLESPASKDIIPKPLRNRKTNVFIVCDGSGADRIHSVLSSAGAVNIHSNT